MHPSPDQPQRTILLLDNGSSRAATTRALRGLATALAERVGEPIAPVSLLHSDKVPAADLDGLPAATFATFVAHRLAAGIRDFLVVPLFFGPSRALTEAIPEQSAILRARYGPLRMEMAAPLCPLPRGEPRLVEILRDNLERAAAPLAPAAPRVVLVDHGSPIPEVTAVRHWLAGRLRATLGATLGPAATLVEAAMERRPGPAYDFNGERLDTALARLAAENGHRPIVMLPLFLAAGRHAGPGGDIDSIRGAVVERHPGLEMVVADLVGGHPQLIEILAARIHACGPGVGDRPPPGG